MPARKPAKKPAKRSAPTKVDFSDEDSVARAMAAALDVDVGDIKIKQSHYKDFTGDTYWALDIGRQEYFVAEDEDSAVELAKAIVKQDLESEPGIFSPDFIKSHINLDRLRRDLMSDLSNSLYESLADEAKRKPIEFMKEHDIDIPEPSESEMRKYADAMSDEDKSESEIYGELKDMGDAEDRWITMGDEPEVPDSEIVDVADALAEEQLKHPIEYLADVYGREEAVEKAIEIAGIDVDGAAEEAVSADGAGHFLSPYDGNLNDGPGGLVYWRHN